MLHELEIQQKLKIVYQNNNACIEWAYGGQAKYFNRQNT